LREGFVGSEPTNPSRVALGEVEAARDVEIARADDDAVQHGVTASIVGRAA
jgi:hypothetical protein